MFLGKESDFYSKISWGLRDAYYGKKLSDFNNRNKYDNIINQKMLNIRIVHPNLDVSRLLKPENMFVVQVQQDRYGHTYLDASQLFVLTWYSENGNYYIQVLTYHWVYVTGSLIGGGTWMSIRSGIKLYTD